jgi:hypothetical protein
MVVHQRAQRVDTILPESRRLLDGRDVLAESHPITDGPDLVPGGRQRAGP